MLIFSPPPAPSRSPPPNPNPNRSPPPNPNPNPNHSPPPSPQVTAVYNDTKYLLLLYEDTFLCTLDVALANHSLSDEHKGYYTACLFAALAAFHDAGIFLRFLNSSAVYITSKGVPKIADLRYCKKMDGSKTFTICGDPLYFAPEIVSQTG